MNFRRSILRDSSRDFLNESSSESCRRAKIGESTATDEVDPNLSTFDGTQTSSQVRAFVPVFDKVMIDMRGGNQIDELRIATTWQESVGQPVPEPSAWILAATSFDGITVRPGSTKKPPDLIRRSEQAARIEERRLHDTVIPRDTLSLTSYTFVRPGRRADGHRPSPLLRLHARSAPATGGRLWPVPGDNR